MTEAFSDCAPLAAQISANISGSSYARPCATNRYPPTRLSAEFGPQPAIHTPAQVSTSIALNHTTPTLIRLTATGPNGITTADSTPAAGTVASPSRHSSASGARVVRRWAASSRGTSASGAASTAQVTRRPAARAASPASAAAAATVNAASSGGTTSTAHSGALPTTARTHPGRQFVKVRVQAGHDQPGRGEFRALQHPGQHREQRGGWCLTVACPATGRGQHRTVQPRIVTEQRGHLGQIA